MAKVRQFQFNSVLTRALPDTHKRGRGKRIVLRWVLFSIIGIIATIGIIIIGLRLLPEGGIASAVYALHDSLYLPLKGNLWTRALPQYLWIWLVLFTGIVLFLLSWLSDRSFLLWWHKRLLQWAVRRPLPRRLLKITRVFPNWLLPEALLREASIQAWEVRLIDLGENSLHSSRLRQAEALLAQWELLVAVSGTGQQVELRERAVHQVVMLALYGDSLPIRKKRQACAVLRQFPVVPDARPLSMDGLLTDAQQLALLWGEEASAAVFESSISLDDLCERTIARAETLEDLSTLLERHYFHARSPSPAVDESSATWKVTPGDGLMALAMALWTSELSGDVMLAQRFFEAHWAYTLLASALTNSNALRSWSMRVEEGDRPTFQIIQLAQLRAAYARLSKAHWNSVSAQWQTELDDDGGWITRDEVESERMLAQVLGRMAGAEL